MSARGHRADGGTSVWRGKERKGSEWGNGRSSKVYLIFLSVWDDIKEILAAEHK